MKKITELTEKRFRTTHKKDALGNRIKGREEYIAKRPVRCISGGPRFGHYIIDLFAIRIIATVLEFFITLAMTVSHEMQDPATMLALLFSGSLILILLYPTYYFFFEYKWQRTPGKFLTKSIVINEYGEKPDLRQIALRSLIRIVPFEPFSCLGDENRGWHDRWSDTWVVTKEELAALKRLQQEQA